VKTNFLTNFSKSEKRRVYAILNQIQANAHKKKWKCLSPDCSLEAVNSHLLQKNGILSNIAVNSHVYKLTFKKTIDETKGGEAIFEREGINDAMAYPIFCNDHDCHIFKTIESSSLNLEEYKAQLLFTYRSLCCELHKKMVGVEYYKRVLESRTLDLYIDKNNYVYLKQSYDLGVQDCIFYKSQIEHDLRDNSRNYFFKVFKYPLLKICASALFTPLNESETGTGLVPFKYVFINIIPYNNNLFVLLGYHKSHLNAWMKNYINSWSNLDDLSFQQKVSEVLATRIETFCLSPSIVDKMRPEKRNLFLNFSEKNLYNFYENQSFSENIFS
jgi:hypothetical protein